MSMSFKNLIDKKKQLILVGVTEPIEALMLKVAGFKAAYISGAALSASLGFLDEGRITLDKMIQTVSDIRKVSDLPLLVDCDTGLLPEVAELPFDNTASMKENAHIMTHLLADAGADGVQIEDQLPTEKRCGHLSGKKLISTNDMFWKVRMVAQQRRSKDLLVVARTDARAVEGLDAAIFRAHRYINAGADAIFPEALESLEEFKEFRRQVPKIPLVANLAEHGKTPPLVADQLFAAGYQIVLIPATPFRMMLKTFETALEEIRRFGSLNFAVENDELISRNELNKFIKKRSKIYKKKTA